MFYELLREWEAKHEDAGWNLESQLGEKIRTLVSARTDLANYLHLARLFVTQLVLVYYILQIINVLLKCCILRIKSKLLMMS